MFVEPSAPYGPPLPPRPAPAQPPFIEVGGAGRIPIEGFFGMREKKYFQVAPAARLWVDEARIVIDLDHVLQRLWKVDPIDRLRDQVRLIRLVHRPFVTAITVVLADQTEPRLYFSTADPEQAKAALDERGWWVEEQRSKLRRWVPVA